MTMWISISGRTLPELQMASLKKLLPYFVTYLPNDR